jgi:hypothetical protein
MRQRLQDRWNDCRKRVTPDGGGELLLMVNDEWRRGALARCQAAEPHSKSDPGTRLTSLFTRASRYFQCHSSAEKRAKIMRNTF